jgi:N-methylhydantoinase B/oxoprolinase/acetone carboxylase alpha subunit
MRERMQVPQNSLLCPSQEAAVVGGNVLTSQRVTDIILKAFKAMACSYGCMNNFTFGDAGMGYYETIAGGGGAGPGFHGCDAVQMHMTNTRITDPEVFERYYPVSLRQFQLRTDSSGSGQWHGGQGVVREVEFLRPLEVGLLTERRSLAPGGLEGGGEGARGENMLIRRDGRQVNLGGKASLKVAAGDRCGCNIRAWLVAVHAKNVPMAKRSTTRLAHHLGCHMSSLFLKDLVWVLQFATFQTRLGASSPIRERACLAFLETGEQQLLLQLPET